MTSPPKSILHFLRWFCREDYIDEIEGDLTEIFKKEHEISPRLAKWKFALKAIRYFRPEFIKPLKNYQPSSFSMYKNYLKIGWRNLLKKKGYSFINIFGLALGMACCLLIFLYVNYERSFDNYHAKGDRIYRLIHGSKDEAHSRYWVWNNAPIGPALHDNFPEIDKVLQFSGRSDILLTYGENSFQEEGVFFMDSMVFDVFSWKLLKGNPKTALAKPFSIVLTESTAKKYFGSEDPIG
ncbi:MAG TPA: ABC transporter permease, partial [Cyclobacteriaceae bacterium]|nr:ABC transporter permease [Cyclobacteriaceae bacterium]